MSDPAQFKLIIEDDEGKRSVVPVDLGEVSIGRLESSTIRLDERNISRQHAKLVKDNGAVFAEDLDSYNGVWINGDRINGRQEVRDGDLIKIGDFHLELRGEGLQRRSEETTQRTMIPTRDSTRVDGRVAEAAADTGEVPKASPPPAPRETAKTPPPPRSEETRNEPTAIIRMDSPELQAQRGASASIAGDRAKLVCVSAQFAGKEFELGKTEVVIGRTSDNDIGIDHRSVSRQHAKIVVSGKRYLLIDLKSANGTLVNGEAYAQTELKRGDLIELGHLKFRFVPPGESYTPTADELAAMRLGGAADSPPRSFERRVPVLLIAGAVAAAVALVTVLAVWLSGDDEGKPPREIVEVPPPATGAAEVDSLIAKGQQALSQRRWQQVETFANAALAFDATSAPARKLLETAQGEMAAQTSYDAAIDAMGRNDWASAWRSLQALPASSVYAAQSRALVDQVKGALVSELLGKAREAFDGQDFDGASSFAQQVSGIDAGRPELAKLLVDIEHAQSTRGVRPSSPPASGRKPSQASRPPAPKDPKEQKPSPVATPPPPPAVTAKPPADPKAVFAEAVNLLKANNLDGAIESLNKCIQIDAGFAQCYRALGIAYAKSGNGPKAARYYKQYLKVDPNARDAEQVRKLLEQYESAP